MPTRNIFIRHIFQGGWSTDFGPTVDISPDNTGKVPIPFLIDVDNCFYELDGGPHKIGGTKKLNPTVIESGEQIRGLFDYWRQGTVGSPTQKRVVHAGTKILQDNADGIFSDLFTGLEDDKVPSYTTFDDILIIASDSNIDVPKSWDQTTAQNLAGTPPNFAFSATHKNRSWAAGEAANPSRLYYCELLDPEDWTGAGSGSIDIDPGDGDIITAIASHKNELWVFKGPYKGSIHRITGSAPTGSDSFARTTFIEGLGSVSHNLLFRFRDDLGFVWSDGTVHSLNATSAFGDFNESALSRPIHKYLRERLNLSRLTHAWAATDVNRSHVLFSVPTDTSADNNLLLMFSYSFEPVRWAPWPAFSSGSVARIIDQANKNLPTIFVGDNDGFVRKTNQADHSMDGVTAINALITLPYLNYGFPISKKTISIASVGIAPKGSYSATLGWRRDNNAQQTHTFTQGGGDVLGPATSNVFTLGDSLLSGSEYVDRFMDLEEGGEFRSIQFQVKNSGFNEDLEVHSISAAIKQQAWSTEN